MEQYNFSNRKRGTGAAVPSDNVYFFFLGESKGVCQCTTLKPQTNKISEKRATVIKERRGNIYTYRFASIIDSIVLLCRKTLIMLQPPSPKEKPESLLGKAAVTLE